MFFSSKKKGLNRLLKLAIEAGLGEDDAQTVDEFIIHKEYGLAFDTIVCQLFEYDNEISPMFYSRIEEVGKSFGYNSEQYDFMKNSIRYD